jgi:hypothetical protein
MKFFSNLSIAKRLYLLNIAGVTQAASETGGAADGVLGATKELNEQTVILRGAVSTSLDKVKAA